MLLDLAKVRMSVRDRVVRMGVGPFRRPAELMAGYGRFGDWLKAYPSEQSFHSRTALYDFINGSILSGGPIDYLEFGVFRGESIRYWSKLNRDEGSRFIGFDSFEGVSEPWVTSLLGLNTIEMKEFDVGGVAPAIPDGRVSFVKGYFQDSLPGFLKGYRPAAPLVIHMDADLYTSTLYVLCSIDHLIRPGTVILFDEFASINHEFRALNDYVASYRHGYTLLGYTKPYYHQIAIRIDH